MYVKATIAALTLAIAAPAFANTQLAGSAGVEPGVFTTNQLAAIKAANDSDERIGFERTSNDIVSTQSVATDNQLARSLGVEGQGLSLSELAMLKDRLESDRSE
ncbi:hypothetical protein [Parasulfitobacter algicola]|uniref:Uncharacterized protein n=1 Tax=Parasulfitobacter algicola TaxID=2614809 RepID=A0ABX2ITN7_9RHOB|nr:hypothetical protein [Sulfitobacter algicola]NSX54187.1 hypothetical protein [Sulfitobacter algicola]NSX55702.1 hypothetical protein [Sulfitobacter algicola]